MNIKDIHKIPECWDALLQVYEYYEEYELAKMLKDIMDNNLNVIIKTHKDEMFNNMLIELCYKFDNIEKYHQFILMLVKK